MRGSRDPMAVSNPFGRSIPACAGEPSPSSCLTMMSPVYPRVCGGATEHRRGSIPDVGLSPRVRGSRHGNLGVTFPLGSIPACAGEPRGTGTGALPMRVYPRVCGGASQIRPSHRRLLGLSPRVRGSRPKLCESLTPTRSIPACAGEPVRSSPPNRKGWVYPRVCGGATKAWTAIAHARGLSPRVRGSL